MEDNKKIIVTTFASFGKIKMQLNDLKDIIQSSMSKLDDKILQTESMLEESNGEFKKILSHNTVVDDLFQ